MPSTVSRYCWAYENPYRTAAIVGAASTSYLFGDYSSEIEKSPWKIHNIQNQIAEFNAYNSRTPTQIDQKRKFPEFMHAWNPTTVQHAIWMLGKCTDLATDTFEPYTTTTQKIPLTIRFEEAGGTTPRLVNAVGCYLIELYCRARIGTHYYVEGTFAWSDIEDQGDGANAVLTTMPTQAGGAGVSQIYSGSPIVVYDVGGGGQATLIDVIMAEWRIKQNWDYCMDYDEEGQNVYLHTFERPELILTAYMKEGTKWDQFIDRTVKNYSVQVMKPRQTYNINWIFDKVRILDDIQTTKKVRGGLIESKLICSAEKVTGTFVPDSTGTWADHFKTAT